MDATSSPGCRGGHSAICAVPTSGDGTLCGDVLFLGEEPCVSSPATVGTFLCGQEFVGGDSYATPVLVSGTIDLAPAGCLS